MDVRICEQLYRNHPLLGNGSGEWTFTILRELHRTESAKLFRTNGKGWPLIEGKNFGQFIFDYEKHVFTIDPEEGLRHTSKIRKYGSLNKQFHDAPRLAFRHVGSSTNVRSMIACILPKHVFTPDSAFLVLPRYDGELGLEKEYSRMISYLAGIFNSMVFDYLIRLRITMNLNHFFVYQTPIPVPFSGRLADEIVKVSGQLSSTDEQLNHFANDLGLKIRPLNMEERVDLAANLNALVAKHYGLDRHQLETVMSSFVGFEEDGAILKMNNEIKWNDQLFRKFNGETRKRVLDYFDKL